jgi:ribosome-binding factor A
MTIKQERMMDRVREILSGLLLLEVTDPALGGVTVTDVVMDRELEYARVFVNALGEEERQAEVMAGLKRANGFLRRELGKRIRLRRVPVLHFEWDTTFSRAEAIESKLDKVRAELREKDQQAQQDQAAAATGTGTGRAADKDE